MKNIAAALIFFTRLPFWRLKVFQVSPEHFKQAINYWTVTGWLTGGVMAGTLWLSAWILPESVAILIALLSRLLITGALHEDGLADFLDGFGGGNHKERILSIMKDSHIGTYGVLGLIIYFFLLYTLLSSIPLHLVCVMMLIADPLSKLISSQITRFLPYARTAETSKSGAVYTRMSNRTFLVSCLFGLTPLLLIPNRLYLLAISLPMILFIGLILLMKKKIGGYSGDCCGALFLLCELSFYMGIVILFKII